MSGYITQLRTTNLDKLLEFYSDVLGYSIEFRYEDFYAGINVEGQILHLKLVDEQDPGIPFVAAGEHLHLYISVVDLEARCAELGTQFKAKGMPVPQIQHQPWGDEFVIQDPEGHTLYYGRLEADSSP